MAIQEFGGRTAEKRIFQVVSEIIDLDSAVILYYLTGPLVRELHIEALAWLYVTVISEDAIINVGVVDTDDQFVDTFTIPHATVGDILRLPLATTDNKLALGEAIMITTPNTTNAGTGKLIVQLGVPGQGES